jgi:hypothetical protein
MSTLILILLSTYVQYQPYRLSPTRRFVTMASKHHNTSAFVAPNLQTMNSNPADQEDAVQALADPKGTPIDQMVKSTSAQRPARRESSKKGLKELKGIQSKRPLTGLHGHESDISKDLQKKKPLQPPGNTNGDLRTMFSTTGASGLKPTPPYVPVQIQVTKLMQATMKQAMNRSINPKSRTSASTTESSATNNQKPPATKTVTTTPTSTMVAGKPKTTMDKRNTTIEKHTTASTTTTKTTTSTMAKSIKKLMKASFTTTKPTTEKYKNTTEKHKNVTNQTQPTPALIGNTATHTPTQSPNKDNPDKAPNHPTRNFSIPPWPATGNSITEKSSEHASAVNLSQYDPPIALTVVSPMRTTPFTTPIILKLHGTGVTEQINLGQSKAQPVLAEHTPTAPTASTGGNMMPNIIPQALQTTITQSPTPIQYYKDPLSESPGTPLPTGDPSPPQEKQTEDRPQPPHISEPPLDPDEFPAHDDPNDQQEQLSSTPQNLDKGYATAMATHDGMESETNTLGTDANNSNDETNTIGTDANNSNDASRPADNMDEATDGDSTQERSQGQSTSRRSCSSDDNTTATNETAATPPHHNRTEAMEVDSDDEIDPDDANLKCPHPNHFKTFWRADYVTSIPTNTNTVLAVACKLSETLSILQTIDKSMSVYPYEANPKLKPIHEPVDFLTLGTELYSYADKNNLWKYPKNEMKTCRLILFLAMNSDFRATCKAFNRLAEDSQLYPRALNYP